MVQMASSSSSPVTIRVSSEGKGTERGGGFRGIALTSPIRRSSISNNPNSSPLSSSRGKNRASSGGRYCSMSKDEVTEAVNSDFTVSYTVHIPRTTPDRKPMSSSQTSLPTENMYHEKPERSYISGTIFTGGFNSVTRGHEIIERSSDRSSETMKSMGIVCSINGCDGTALLEGDSRMPCECGFKICKECYLECLGSRGGGGGGVRIVGCLICLLSDMLS